MAQKPYHSEKLDTIRQKIDALDTKIHDTLVERAELVLQIGEEKRANNIEVVQPAREARMIRRLLGKHKGSLPEMAVVRIWRELVGAVSLLQTGIKIVVADVPDCPEHWDLAKDYFGSCLPMTRAGSPLGAIGSVREGNATFAVVPFPEDNEEQPWWDYLGVGTEEAMNITVRLPHGDDPQNLNPDYRSLVVGKTGFDSSDEDRSFVMVTCDQSVSRAKIASSAEESQLKPLSLSSKREPIDSDNPMRKHLLEVDDYVRDGDARIESFQEKFEEGVQVYCVGGYPVPPTYSKTILPKQISLPTAPLKD